MLHLSRLPQILEEHSRPDLAPMKIHNLGSRSITMKMRDSRAVDPDCVKNEMQINYERREATRSGRPSAVSRVTRNETTGSGGLAD
jgi:hypothetical protein